MGRHEAGVTGDEGSDVEGGEGEENWVWWICTDRGLIGERDRGMMPKRKHFVWGKSEM